MTDQTKTPEKPLPDEQQWQLALAYLRRAETAAHVLRAVLFFAAIAVAALVLLNMQLNMQMRATALDRVFYINVGSVVLAVLAIFFLVKSWQLQKEKAIERFKYFKAKDADAVALYEGVAGQLKGLQSRFWDWLAFWALASAILMQLAVRTTGVIDAVPPPPLPSLPPLPL
jgi:hypothetical protein